jgi:hypothetical protein
MSNIKQFPPESEKTRLSDYKYYEKLFLGNHFDAFSIKVDSQNYNKAYAMLRYVTVNFAGLISKVVADFLFSEPPSFTTEDGHQEFIDALVHENNLHTQNYESALSNSYKGDALYKIRIGPRFNAEDESTIIIEDIKPDIYFPHLDGMNIKAKPQIEELAWVFEHAEKKYLRKEIHKTGKIINEIYEIKEEEIGLKIEDFDSVGMGHLIPEEETGIDRNLLVHVPNWKTGDRYFGISDYKDLDSIFYAINNRMSKTDNILDKHSDPILMLPEGILDEEGKVRREKLHMIEVPDGAVGATKGKPEYIVWNASLENAFKEVEKLVEFMFMVSETSPDILGMGQGKSDSGRALKLKILRTIAKAARKKLYYDRALKEVLYISQLLAKKHNIKVGGIKLNGEPVVPDIGWMDGLPIDNSEQIDDEVKRVDAGLSSAKEAIMRIDGIDEDTAIKKAKEIKDENKVDLPAGKPSLNPFKNK